MRIFFENYLTRGFWGDEAWTALISQFSVADIIRITGEDFHPPFYYLLVHFFIKVFGPSEWIRVISAFFWILTPFLVYKLAKTLKRGIEWPAAILTIASPILFTYAGEARNYALVAFISVGSTLAFWNGLYRKGKAWWITYWLLMVAGVYTHYYMWFIFASHGLYWLLVDRVKIKSVVLVYLGLVAAQLPWIPTLLSQVSSVVGDYWIGGMDRRTHWEFFYRVVAGDVDTPQRLFTTWSVILLLAVSVVASRLRKKQFNKGYVLLWFWLLVPILIPTLISFYKPVFFYRYLIFSIMPIILIWLWGLKSLRGSLVAGGTAFVLALYLSTNIISFQRYPESMREVLGKVQNEHGDIEKIVTVLPSFAEVMFYAPKEVAVQVRPEGLVQFSGKSLLDAYSREGIVKIEEPEEGERYILAEPGPKAEIRN